MIHPHQTKWSNIRYRLELIKFASAENYNVCEAPQKLPSKFFHFLGFVTSNFLIQFNSNHRKSRHNSIEEAKNWCFFCNWLIEFDRDEFSQCLWVFEASMISKRRSTETLWWKIPSSGQMEFVSSSSPVRVNYFPSRTFPKLPSTHRNETFLSDIT